MGGGGAVGNSMDILALDISSVSTGYAFYKKGKLKDKGVLVMSKIKRHSERLSFFNEEIVKLVEKFSPEMIAVEDIYKGRNPKTHKVLALYHGIVYKLSYDFFDSDPIVMYPSEIRSILSDEFDVVLKKKGVKDKELTFDFIKKHFNLESYTFKKDNDITDAIAIGLAVEALSSKSESQDLISEYIGCARSQKKKKRKKKGDS